MIIDNVALTGRSAYLQDWGSGGPIDLASAPHRGQTPKMLDGQVLETTTIDLHIECDDLDKFMTPATPPPVVFTVRKELFPGLYLDPFHYRAHNIAGLQDFRQGELTAMRVQMVDGIPTLVSDGDPDTTARWISPLYRLSHPISFGAAAWELANSRLTPEIAYRYWVRLHWWPQGADPEDPGAASQSMLADGANPTDPTHVDAITTVPPTDAMAYRIEFWAEVRHEAALTELEVGELGDGSTGTPLLRAVNLLQSVEPGNRYASLHELAVEAEDFVVFPENGPRKRMFVTVPMSSSLTEGEAIGIELSADFAAALTHMTARVQGRVFARPPDAERPGG